MRVGKATSRGRLNDGYLEKRRTEKAILVCGVIEDEETTFTKTVHDLWIPLSQVTEDKGDLVLSAWFWDKIKHDEKVK